MKLLVFAHTPPPHHGQSYMVQLMLDGMGGDWRQKQAKSRGYAQSRGIECYHVNVRLSKKLEDIGDVRIWKMLLLVWYCAEAIWCRFRYGITTLYYVPAPGKKSALYRDWLVMALCRPFFKRVIFHWHATSLSRWLERCCSIRTRGMAYRMMGKADLSIVLSRYNRVNAEKLCPQRVEVIPNGIPDPCPRFRLEALPRRSARLAARNKIQRGEKLTPVEVAAAGEDSHIVSVLFLSHCTEEKGVFDAAEAVVIANQKLKAADSPFQCRLVVAGSFPNRAEKARFDEFCQRRDSSGSIHYAGFVQREKKAETLLTADILCFSSHWENQPVTVIEALAYGLPTVVTDLPSVVEMMPDGYSGVARVKNPEDIARALLSLVQFSQFEALRQRFEQEFRLETFVRKMRLALETVATIPPGTVQTECDQGVAQRQPSA